jgi:hypothetical protein
MNTSAMIPGCHRRRFLQRACGLLIGLLLGAPSLAGRPEPRCGPPEAAFYRPLRSPPGGA